MTNDKQRPSHLVKLLIFLLISVVIDIYNTVSVKKKGCAYLAILFFARRLQRNHNDHNHRAGTICDVR